MPDAALDWQSSWRSNSSPFGVAVRSFPNFFVPPESLGALKQSMLFFLVFKASIMFCGGGEDSLWRR